MITGNRAPEGGGIWQGGGRTTPIISLIFGNTPNNCLAGRIGAWLLHLTAASPITAQRPTGDSPAFQRSETPGRQCVTSFSPSSSRVHPSQNRAQSGMSARASDDSPGLAEAPARSENVSGRLRRSGGASVAGGRRSPRCRSSWGARLRRRRCWRCARAAGQPGKALGDRVEAAGFALLAAISPTALLVAAVHLGSARPRQTGLSYLARAVVMTTAIAAAVLVALRSAHLDRPEQHAPRDGLAWPRPAAAGDRARDRGPPPTQACSPGEEEAARDRVQMVADPSPRSASPLASWCSPLG